MKDTRVTFKIRTTHVRLDRLPLLCRLRGHYFRPATVVAGGYWRLTCSRCRDLDVRLPR